MKQLNISDDLSLPLDAVTQTFAVMGIRGSGKTHTASVMAEEMLKAGQPIVIYDPTGAWFGLKTSADGKRPGHPVVIFGGEHPDAPLEESAGDTIARVIVERRFPAILDVSLMRKSARIRFMQDFCESLYHRNREALHFFADEVHEIAPQRAFPESARLLGAMEDIVLKGRRRGLGLTVISQRPALVNTNIRTQCATLIAMRIVGPHDLKAIREWTDAHGTPERSDEMMKSLATLKKGEGWVWSVWLDIFKRLRFRQRETFDSSATPEVGKANIIPKVVASIDLAALGDEIRSTVERAKADDPRELKKKISELQKQLAARPKDTVEKIVEKIIEVPVLKNGQLDRIEKIAARMEAQAEMWKAEAMELRRLIAPAAAPRPVVKQSLTTSRTTSPSLVACKPRQNIPTRAPMPERESSGDLTGGERAILIAAAQHQEGVTREQLSVLTGYKRSSRDTYLQRLRSRGYVDQRGETILATDDGITALGDDFEPLPTGEELQKYWLQRLQGGEQAILRILIEQYPNAVPRDAISDATEYKRSSRDTYLQRLSARKLVESIGRGEVKASGELF